VHYLIFGTGAVGGLLGTRLALSGQSVTFLVRPRLVEILQRHGLNVSGDGPQGWLRNPAVITSLDQAFNQHPPDVILLAVKAYDCQEAAETIRSVTMSSIPVVCLLNGVSNEATLASVLGSDRVVPATLTTAVQMTEPGKLRVERERGLGLSTGHQLVAQLRDEIIEAGIRTFIYRNSKQMKWSKTLVNIVTNASSAIIGWPPWSILGHSELCRLEIEALRETARVMREMGLRPQNLPGVPVNLLGWAIFLPVPIIQPFLQRIVSSGRGDKLPSFHYDIGRGRSEIYWLNGAIAREGTRQGVPTPANTVLTETMQSLVDGREDPTQFRDRPDELLSRAKQTGVPGLG
jgi:2-dehydropantoate 2-reductase